MDRSEFLKHFMEIDRPLRSFLLGLTGRQHDTDDLLQAVWQILWEKLDQYDDRRPFRAWAFGVARLEALKWRQRLARSREVLSEDAVSLVAETAVEMADELNARHVHLVECLKKVQGFHRRLLHMKYGLRMTAWEIASKVGKSTPAVEMSLVRIRHALRECVESKMARVA